jgi:hypothetical protein
LTTCAYWQIRQRRGLALSQLLTLYTLPVIYLYLDRLRGALPRRRRDVEEAPMTAVAAE